jgi:D-xylulose reductase
MKALVLEKVRELRLRDIELPTELGPDDVKIAMRCVGVCGSDVHFYEYGNIGPFVVRAPMVLGHEGAGVVVAVGRKVTNLKPGDRVCMEPGIPDWSSRASRNGHYNLDPKVRFWATPPVHGCLTPEVIHPANLTFKLPDNVSMAEGALVEPLAVGMQAATKAHVTPGAIGVVVGCGTIGIVTALAALAAGCSQVIITDMQQEKLDIAARYPGLVPVNIGKEDPIAKVHEITDNWGADVVFECSGHPKAYERLFDHAAPGATIVLVGMPPGPVPYDVVAAEAKELHVEHVFRYTNVYAQAVSLIAFGKVDVKPLISKTFPFEKAVEAFEFAAQGLPSVVKTQIVFE